MSDQGRYQPLSYFQLMEVSLRELLVEKGIVTEEQVSAETQAMRERTPERGAITTDELGRKMEQIESRNKTG